MTFEEFVKRCKHGFEIGAIKLEDGVEMTDIDYAVYWSICKLREDAIAKGEECVLTKEDIYAGMLKYCGEDTINRIMSERASK